MADATDGPPGAEEPAAGPPPPPPEAADGLDHAAPLFRDVEPWEQADGGVPAEAVGVGEEQREGSALERVGLPGDGTHDADEVWPADEELYHHDRPLDAPPQLQRRIFGGPPTDEEVLVAGEVVVYKQRQHWMVLRPSFLKALAATWLALLALLPWSPASMTVPEWLFTIAALVPLVRHVQRTSWPRLLGQVLVVVVGAAVLAIGVRGAVVLAAGMVVVGFLDELVQWRWYRYLYVTNRRMVQTNGILTRSFATMPIAKITDVRLKITWLGEQLGYGEFFVESAGQNQALGHLEYLLAVEEFYHRVLLLATSPVSVSDDGY